MCRKRRQLPFDLLAQRVRTAVAARRGRMRPCLRLILPDAEASLTVRGDPAWMPDSATARCCAALPVTAALFSCGEKSNKKDGKSSEEGHDEAEYAADEYEMQTEI